MYNKDNLYIPKNFEELEEELLEAYNEAFNSALTMDQFRYTNIYAIHLNTLQAQLQNENNIGLLYSKLLAFIKGKTDLEIIPKGATYTGLYNSLKSLKKPSGSKVDQTPAQSQVIAQRLFTLNQDNEVNNQNTTSLTSLINIADANSYPDDHKNGEMSIVIDYDETPENNLIIADCLANNAPVGIQMLGDIKQNWVSKEGMEFTFRWQKWQVINIKVKLFYQYDSRYYGEKLSTSQIQNIYYNNFNRLYKAGGDLIPSILNDIYYYPGLSYLNSQITIIKGGEITTNNTKALSINQTIKGTYNQRFNIASIDDISTVEDN
jgi:hypothetical protein